MLSEEALFEFNRIYKETYGVELGSAELAETANTVFEIFKVVYRPMDGLKGTPQSSKMITPPIKRPLSFEMPHLGSQS